MRLPNFERGGLTSLLLTASKQTGVASIFQSQIASVIYKMIKTTDVFIQNWRPGAADRLELGEAKLERSTPIFIYCSIQAGPSGPTPIVECTIQSFRV